MLSGAQTLRVGQPGGTTILRALPSGQVAQVPSGKQIITVKTGQVTSQPQIVTLVKTTQGMQVAQVCRKTISKNIFLHIPSILRAI